MQSARIVMLTSAFGISMTPAIASDGAFPQKVIALRTVDGGGQTLDASIAGHSGAFMFDSGWGVTAVTPQFAEKIGCRPWGQLTGFRGNGERVDIPRCDKARVTIDKVVLPIPTLSVVNLMRYLPKSPVTYAGAIGLDAFAGKAITIRSRAKQLIVESRNSLALRSARAIRVPIRIVRDVQGAALTVNLGVPTAYGTAWMELDTGNYGGTMIGKHIAALVGLDPRTEGLQHLKMPVVPGITIDGQVRVYDLIMDGNLGKDFLDQWDVTLDLANGQGWLARAQD